MKARIVTVAVVLMSSIQAVAQFNTIGESCQKSEIAKRMSSEDSLGQNGGASVDSVDAGHEMKAILREYLSLSYPLKSITITSGFGMRHHPLLQKYIMHSGVDLQARFEEVYSMFPGIVISAGEDVRAGKYVTVKSSNYTISYCHLSAVMVREGCHVGAGEVIARSGNSGMSTAPHLHLTTKKDGRAIDPTILLDYVRSVKEKCISMISFH